MNKYFLAALAAATAWTPAANAATLISATVTGPSGTIWNTAKDNFFTLFLASPANNYLNPNDNFSGYTPREGANNFVILGEGFRPGETQNSDLLYNLTLSFADGATITGQYVFDTATPGGEFRNGTTATAGNTTYRLTGFGWDRSRADNVSAFSLTSGGDPNDYTGQFSFSSVTAAVPEPATWGMLVLGFGVMGGAMRTRSRQSRDARLMLRMA